MRLDSLSGYLYHVAKSIKTTHVMPSATGGREYQHMRELTLARLHQLAWDKIGPCCLDRACRVESGDVEPLLAD